MKRFHIPIVGARYWAAILLASVFGTNTGDLYAHASGLSLWLGLLLLAALAVLAFVAERVDPRPGELWYWLVIVIIRTGATNIADWLAFRVRIPPLAPGAGLVFLLAALSGAMQRVAADRGRGEPGLPTTGAVYWTAMLTAGVLGTVLGDDASQLVGQGWASILLGLALVAVLAATRGQVRSIAIYWATVGVARTAGTATGDWLAENSLLHIGLVLSTLLSGAAFLSVLVLMARFSSGATRRF